VVNECQDYFKKSNPSKNEEGKCQKAVVLYNPAKAELVNADVRKCMNEIAQGQAENKLAISPLGIKLEFPFKIGREKKQQKIVIPPEHKALQECYSMHEKAKRYMVKLMYRGIENYPALKSCLNRIYKGNTPSLKSILADSDVEKKFNKDYIACVKDPNTAQRVDL
jgi:hypothetical protein